MILFSVKTVTSKKSHPRVAEFFPFPEIRPAQEEALSVIEKAHAAHKKFVVLEIPTGGGKLGIAIAAAQWAKAVFGGGLLHTFAAEDAHLSMQRIPCIHAHLNLCRQKSITCKI